MTIKDNEIAAFTLRDDDDTFDVKARTLVCEVVEGSPAYEDPEKACRDAIAAYLNTDEGKREYKGNRDHCNWSDAANIPTRFLEEQGFVDLGPNTIKVVDLRYNEEFEPNED